MHEMPRLDLASPGVRGVVTRWFLVARRRPGPTVFPRGALLSAGRARLLGLWAGGDRR